MVAVGGRGGVGGKRGQGGEVGRGKRMGWLRGGKGPGCRTGGGRRLAGGGLRVGGVGGGGDWGTPVARCRPSMNRNLTLWASFRQFHKKIDKKQKIGQNQVLQTEFAKIGRKRLGGHGGGHGGAGGARGAQEAPGGPGGLRGGPPGPSHGLCTDFARTRTEFARNSHGKKGQHGLCTESHGLCTEKRGSTEFARTRTEKHGKARTGSQTAKQAEMVSGRARTEFQQKRLRPGDLLNVW